MVSAGCMHLEQLSKHRWIFVFTFDLSALVPSVFAYKVSHASFRLQQFALSLAGTMSHHFRGVQHYADKLMDYADGRAVFRGRGQRPSNKDVLKQMSAIDKCRQRSYFKPATERERDCSCGWHTKAAARRKSPTAAAAGPSTIAGACSQGKNGQAWCQTPWGMCFLMFCILQQRTTILTIFELLMFCKNQQLSAALTMLPTWMVMCAWIWITSLNSFNFLFSLLSLY